MIASELSILALYGLLIIVLLLTQVLLVIAQEGLPFVASARDQPRIITGLAGRAIRTVDNSIAGMALFGPAVLLVHVTGTSSAGTLLAAQIFLAARLLFVPIYYAGIPYVRGPVWMAGLFATGYLYLQGLGA